MKRNKVPTVGDEEKPQLMEVSLYKVKEKHDFRHLGDKSCFSFCFLQGLFYIKIMFIFRK